MWNTSVASSLLRAQVVCTTFRLERLVTAIYECLAALFIMRVYAICGSKRSIAIVCLLPVLGRIGIDVWVNTVSRRAQAVLTISLK